MPEPKRLPAHLGVTTRQWTLCCGKRAPDGSGRTCDKPEGHNGDHWTYGGHTLTWPRQEHTPLTEERLVTEGNEHP